MEAVRSIPDLRPRQGLLPGQSFAINRLITSIVTALERQNYKQDQDIPDKFHVSVNLDEIDYNALSSVTGSLLDAINRELESVNWNMFRIDFSTYQTHYKNRIKWIHVIMTMAIWSLIMWIILPIWLVIVTALMIGMIGMIWVDEKRIDTVRHVDCTVFYKEPATADRSASHTNASNVPLNTESATLPIYTPTLPKSAFQSSA